eukprot:gb/GFBE01009975.1/.p1 GENE.gb/GFBE01009975.1/~~gb/GFBE01009975.1/.p1  ORF type:complete len:281 (+),score=42.23 gb/GFBE01009975.1/:1-843(+)
MQFFQPLPHHGHHGVAAGPIFHGQHMQHHQSVAAPQVLQHAAPAPTPNYADRNLNDISLEYTYEELREATRNFDEGMKLGSGSYGGVYKGVLKDGTEVAIKVLDVPNEAGFEEEVKVLSKFRHPHLVILMGFARNGAKRLLVYEMLSGGDVHRRLQKSCHQDVAFPWQERVSIALDAACGLSHLHHSSPKVFHRDIKSPNILLDKNGTAKMAGQDGRFWPGLSLPHVCASREACFRNRWLCVPTVRPAGCGDRGLGGLQLWHGSAGAVDSVAASIHGTSS